MHGQHTVLKLIVLGDSGVGKTAMINSFIGNPFDHTHKPTIGCDFFTYTVPMDSGSSDFKSNPNRSSNAHSNSDPDFDSSSNQKRHYDSENSISVQLWDTAGQERFLALGASFFRGSDACVLVFDCTNEMSFRNIASWRNHFIENINSSDVKKFPFLLCANKCDLLHDDEALDLDIDQNIPFQDYRSNNNNSNNNNTNELEENDEQGSENSLEEENDIHAITNTQVPRSSTKPAGKPVNMIAAKSFADHYGMLFYQTSALNGSNIEKAFLELIFKASGINQSLLMDNPFTVTDALAKSTNAHLSIHDDNDENNENEENDDDNYGNTTTVNHPSQDTNNSVVKHSQHHSRHSGKGINLEAIVEKERGNSTQNNNNNNNGVKKAQGNGLYDNCACGIF